MTVHVSKVMHRGAITLVLLLLCACDTRPKHVDPDRLPNDMVQRKWTEDVLLDDGSTIVVQRSVLFHETNSLSGDAYNAVEQDATLAFTGDLASLPAWHEPLMALLLYRDPSANEWTIVATTTSCDVWNRKDEPRVMYLPDKPNTLYWEYRQGENGWREVPLSRLSVGLPVNLLHRYQRELFTSHVTLEFKKVRQGHRDSSEEFLSIVERPRVNCMPSVEARWRRQGL